MHKITKTFLLIFFFAILHTVSAQKENKTTYLDSPIILSDSLSLYKTIDISESDDKPFVVVEQMPSYIGGDATMMQFIADSLRYPAAAVDLGVQGRVVVRFVVGRDGKVRDARVVRGIHPSCDQEALRVVNLMPKWMPGRQNGRPISVYYTLPITFILSSGDRID